MTQNYIYTNLHVTYCVYATNNTICLYANKPHFQHCKVTIWTYMYGCKKICKKTLFCLRLFLRIFCYSCCQSMQAKSVKNSILQGLHDS